MIFSIHIDELQVVTESGDITLNQVTKTKKFCGIPIFKYSFVKNVDLSNYVPPKEPTTPVPQSIVGFSVPRIEISPEEE